MIPGLIGVFGNGRSFIQWCNNRVFPNVRETSGFVMQVTCIKWKLYYSRQNESSITVEPVVKFIWQCNLPMGLYGTFKMPSWRLDFRCSEGKNETPPETTKLKFLEVSQSGLWNKYYLITPNFCAKFQPIGWPQLLVSGTLSQRVTRKTSP